MAPGRLEVDVCVVGGGPAGATLGCRLAMLGHTVAVIEREAFPRAHVGESVSAGVWPLLELIGARGAIEAAGFPSAAPAEVSWGTPLPRRVVSTEPAITVDRGVFDGLLLDRAAAAGATILQPATAGRATVRADGGWELTVREADRCTTVRARYLADASGRRRALGGRRRRTSPRTIALHGLWRASGRDGVQTRVEARPEYWLWGAHIPGAGLRVMAFADPALLLRRPAGADGGLERLYRELVAGAPLFAPLVSQARLIGGGSACDATCYADEEPIDPTRVKVGEAAFAIDPLSSSGVQTAMQTGVAAGVAVASILAADADADAALAYYRAHQAHAVEHHAALAASSYSDCAAFANETFWRRRAAAAPHAAAPDPPPGASADLRDLLARPVGLPQAAVLVRTPCVVGDRVQWRRALAHPALPRPIAFLGDSELAPLLDELGPDRKLGDVIATWAQAVTAPRASAIAGWLARHGLLEPVDAPDAGRARAAGVDVG